jgi:hypothetical protein
MPSFLEEAVRHTQGKRLSAAGRNRWRIGDRSRSRAQNLSWTRSTFHRSRMENNATQQAETGDDTCFRHHRDQRGHPSSEASLLLLVPTSPAPTQIECAKNSLRYPRKPRANRMINIQRRRCRNRGHYTKREESYAYAFLRESLLFARVPATSFAMQLAGYLRPSPRKGLIEYGPECSCKNSLHWPHFRTLILAKVLASVSILTPGHRERSLGSARSRLFALASPRKSQLDLSRGWA